jgi:hypothetical protein
LEAVPLAYNPGISIENVARQTVKLKCRWSGEIISANQDLGSGATNVRREGISRWGMERFSIKMLIIL